MRVNYHLFSGVMRRPLVLVDDGGPCHGHRVRIFHEYPTLVVDVNLLDWALPISLHLGGPLLGKPGLTVRIGPVNIGWSKL